MKDNLQNQVKINKKKFKLNPVMLVVSIIFGIYAISLVIPLAWGFLKSFSSRREFFQPGVFPKVWILKNYVDAFVELESGGNNLFVMLFNSIWYALGGALLQITVASTVAYVCAKYKFELRNMVYYIAVITMMIPIMGSLPAQFRVSNQLGIYDTPLSILGSANFLGMPFVISYAFYKGVSWEYAEAALIDGAGHAKIYLEIMVPMAISPLIALMLTSFIASWNDDTGPLVFLPSYPTLASGFYVYQKRMENKINYPVLFAGLFVAAMPIIVLYLTFQNTLMDLQLGGGMKG